MINRTLDYYYYIFLLCLKKNKLKNRKGKSYQQALLYTVQNTCTMLKIHNEHKYSTTEK